MRKLCVILTLVFWGLTAKGQELSLDISGKTHNFYFVNPGIGNYTDQPTYFSGFRLHLNYERYLNIFDISVYQSETYFFPPEKRTVHSRWLWYDNYHGFDLTYGRQIYNKRRLNVTIVGGVSSRFSEMIFSFGNGAISFDRNELRQAFLLGLSARMDVIYDVHKNYGISLVQRSNFVYYAPYHTFSLSLGLRKTLKTYNRSQALTFQY